MTTTQAADDGSFEASMTHTTCFWKENIAPATGVTVPHACDLANAGMCRNGLCPWVMRPDGGMPGAWMIRATAPASIARVPARGRGECSGRPVHAAGSG
jgi:hypothetical protein